MKLLIICILVFMFCGIVIVVHLHESEPHSHLQDIMNGQHKGDAVLPIPVEIAPLGSEFERFQKLLKTDLETARIELQNIAKKRFSGHILAEEWLPLYFRINRDGFRYISDAQRAHELEIRMLTAINAEKYAKQIQHHQEALEYYAELVDVFPRSTDAIGNEIRLPEKTLPSEEKSHFQLMWSLSDEEKKQRKIAMQHFKNFLEHLTTDPESARTELDSYATIIFENHPLTEEWKKLCFRIVRDKGGNVPDILRFIELRKQMLTDQDPARYAKEIKGLGVFLISLKRIAQKFERQGILETEKIPFNLKLAK